MLFVTGYLLFEKPITDNQQLITNLLSNKKTSPWAWIPSLYFAEGLPYAIVMSVSVIMYKRLGMSNTDIAFYTSWLYLPWVIKPIWSPFVELIKSKRLWITGMQLLIGAALGGVAFTIPTPFYIQATLAFFWLMAFSSATHDIAADGFYMMALNDNQQSFFVGIRTTFYRLALMFGQGALIFIAGCLAKTNWIQDMPVAKQIPYIWSLIFYFLAALFIFLYAYHRFILPKPNSDELKEKPAKASDLLNDFFQIFVSFVLKKGIWISLLFILFYRFSEAQLVKLIQPFLVDSRDVGGLALTDEQLGTTYGIVGIISLMFGGILGGIVIARKGLKYWIWWMVLCLNLPHLAYIYLAYFQPESLVIINIAVGIEQFGYGFGTTAYTMYMIYASSGKYKTVYYSICTGFMALGMMIPGMWAGWLQEKIGYQHFFVWILLCTIPCILVTAFLKIDPKFGIKEKK